jgi:uncharacterized protein
MSHKATAGLLALIALAALPGCGRLFFYPSREFVRNPHLEEALDGIAREDVFFTTPDGLRLHGWMLRPAGRPSGTILFIHGNAGNVSTHVGAVLWLALAGYEVFLFDYRGFGLSEGTPTIEGIHIDTLAALETVAARTPADGGAPIVVLGQSLGGSAAVYAVATSRHKDRVRALVIDSAFSGYRRIAREKITAYLFFLWPLRHPLSLLIDDRFSASRWIGRVPPVPLLIIHGDADEVVPVDHSERLFHDAEGPKRLWGAPPRPGVRRRRPAGPPPGLALLGPRGAPARTPIRAVLKPASANLVSKG